jgi:CPA1 family monovalent cation:H+ antiporter
VSVIATFRGTGAHGRARLLVEAESLFNDGTAAVAFAVALAMTGGHAMGPALISQKLLVMVLGSLFCGLVTSSWILLLSTRTGDHLLQTTLATVAAYGSFLLAEHLQLSGVLATLAAGILFGNAGTGTRTLPPKGREAIESVFEYLAFIANSLVFLLIGMHEAAQPFAALLRPAAIAIGMVILGRAAAVYPICALFRASRLRVDGRHQHILFWGGLRGSLALALALALPDDLPQRNDIVTTAFAVVAFSIFVQGATMTPLLRRLGELSPRAPVNPASETRS